MSADDHGAPPRSPRFEFEPYETIKRRSLSWLLKGLLPSQGLAFLVGHSKAGKTFLALDIALSLAAGCAEVFGRKARQCGVVCVAAEDPNGCRTRVEAWRLINGHPGYLPFELVGRQLDLRNEGEVAELIKGLMISAQRFKANGSSLGMVVIDTLAWCIPGADENSAADMSKVLAALQRIGRETGALVLVVAHFGKSGSDKGIRGWSGLDAASDATIIVERAGKRRTITLAKVKNGVDGGKLGFRLKSVALGQDEDGDVVASCVPVYEPAAEATDTERPKALSAPQQIVLAAVQHVLDSGATHPLPSGAEGAKPGTKAVARDDVRARAMASGLAEDGKPGAVRMRFSRALEGLVAAGRIRIEGELLWLL